MTSEHKSAPVVTVPCVTFQFNSNLDRTRENWNSVTAQFNIPLDKEVEEMHDLTDKVMAVIQRQADFYRLRALYDALHSAEVFKANAEQDMQRIDASEQAAAQLRKVNGRQTPYKPTPEQAQKRLAARNNLDSMDAQIARTIAEITAMENKLGIDIGADSQPSDTDR